jgi:hypothetical protein
MLESIIEIIKINAINFSVLVLFIVVTFILLIFLPKSVYWFEATICPELKLLSENEHINIMKTELIPLLDKCEYKFIYKDSEVFIDKEIPKSYDLFRTIPNIRRITLVKLLPKTQLDRSYGGLFSNKTIRCILPLKISGALQSGIWIDGENKFYMDQWIIFDNSREHAMFNEHKRLLSYILIIDIDRDEKIPIGIAIKDSDMVI